MEERNLICCEFGYCLAFDRRRNHQIRQVKVCQKISPRRSMPGERSPKLRKTPLSLASTLVGHGGSQTVLQVGHPHDCIRAVLSGTPGTQMEAGGCRVEWQSTFSPNRAVSPDGCLQADSFHGAPNALPGKHLPKRPGDHRCLQRSRRRHFPGGHGHFLRMGAPHLEISCANPDP